MKTIRLISLRLENFKGLRDFTLMANSDDVDVRGDNATGKTTIYDGFLWLFFDKDSSGAKDFDIKTRAGGETIPMVDHAVTAMFLIDGKPLLLRKVYAEKYTKKRGQAQADFAGHTTEYFVDEVPVKQKEFKEAVDGIADEELFRLLTNPLHFNETLSWQKRREVLLEVCGSISDDEVMAGNPDFDKLQKALKGRKIDDHKKVVASRRQAINKRLDEIPVRIDQINNDLPEGPKSDPVAIIKKITALQEKVSAKRSEVSRIENGGQVAAKQKELADVETDMAKFRNDYQKSVDALAAGKRKELGELNNQVADLAVVQSNQKRDAEETVTQLNELSSKNLDLTAEWKKINGETFEFTADTVCPTCGQELPEGQIESARNKARASFEESKQRRLQEVTEKGKANRQVNTKVRDKRSAIEVMQRQTAEELNVVVQAAAALQAEIDKLTADVPDLSDLVEWKEFTARQTAIEEEIEKLREGSTEALAAVNAEIDEIDKQIAEHQKTVAGIENRQRLEDQSRELKEEEKKLAKEFEQLEEELYLCEQFIRAKVAMLDERINQHFNICSFRLFRDQINGGLQEVCECTVDGVPYGSINNAARIQAGLDIISTLSRHHQLSAPIFIDNRESVTRLPHVEQQLISLYVDADAKQLKISKPF
ncbi:MAG: hypothetical protein IH612_04880 [Desulfofustis sp.]|nr:hypothetical protein [Desulfofustis sp.]